MFRTFNMGVGYLIVPAEAATGGAAFSRRRGERSSRWARSWPVSRRGGGRAGERARPVGVLVSGRGSNLQACSTPRARTTPAGGRVVISDRERAGALDRARAAGVEAVFVNPKDFRDREAYDQALVRALEARRVGPRLPRRASCGSSAPAYVAPSRAAR